VVCCGQRALPRAHVAGDWRACERNRCSVYQPCGLNRGFVHEPFKAVLVSVSLISSEWRIEEGRLPRVRVCVCERADMGWGS